MREALRPFTREERERVFAAADQVEIRGRSKGWLGRLCRVLCYTGWHPAVLYRSGEFRPALQHGRLQWIRPKNRRQMELPVHRELAPWIQEWLLEPRPRGPARYTQLLDQVGERAGMKVNALRFRHTACIILIRDLHLPSSDVQRLLGVTAKTLLVYAERPIEDIQMDMEKAGW